MEFRISVSEFNKSLLPFYYKRGLVGKQFIEVQEITAELGLQYKDATADWYYLFNIIDYEKFMLTKIKYGI